MTFENKIINAIKSKQKVELNYKGEGNRVVCPHAIYISSTGKTLVDCYQEKEGHIPIISHKEGKPKDYTWRERKYGFKVG